MCGLVGVRFEQMLLLGAVMVFASLSSCGEEEKLPIHKHSSHSHSHYHGELLHSHSSTGARAHAHEWMKNRERYTPYRPSTVGLNKIPLDVSLLAARPGRFHERSVFVQGIVISVVEKGKQCYLELAPLAGKGGGALVHAKRDICASPGDSVGKIATVRGTLVFEGPRRLRAVRWSGHVQGPYVIEADKVQLKPAVDKNAHSHGGEDHSHPNNGPHNHIGGRAGEIVAP